MLSSFAFPCSANVAPIKDGRIRELGDIGKRIGTIQLSCNTLGQTHA